MPFQSASNSLDAPTSASSSDAGQIGAWLLAQPMLVAPAERRAIAARPCASSRWCAAGIESNINDLPGACMPVA